MATTLKNLSNYDSSNIPSANKMRFGIVVSEWNYEITMSMCKGAIETLITHGALEENIEITYVPGSFELSLGSQLLAEKDDVDAVIALGCVIQGETRHFDFICQGVAYGITEVSLKYSKPVIFGVITSNNMQQAVDRSGGKHGNKGVEAAITAIKMAALKSSLKKSIK